MTIQVHAFDWTVYAERVMPAFARWLIDGDEADVYRLYQQTRCAEEEKLLPAPMQRMSIWPRAHAFVEALPHGPYSYREYTRLCSAQQFTALNDRYAHFYTPQLYQQSSALRSIWGAIVEEYCLPWYHLIVDGESTQQDEQTTQSTSPASEESAHNELASLLHAAGLPELAREVSEQASHEQPAQVQDLDPESAPEPADEESEFDLQADRESLDTRPGTTTLGQRIDILRLRGWLASVAVRAMALFEYLAFGRRRMPFGYEAGEPFGSYIGYLTPGEVLQLAACLHEVRPPGRTEAEEDYQQFRRQAWDEESRRIVDEVQPAYATEFVEAVRLAASQGLGLICSVE